MGAIKLVKQQMTEQQGRPRLLAGGSEAIHLSVSTNCGALPQQTISRSYQLTSAEQRVASAVQ